jgi:dipeptidyl aminopeptidase/acylaminoacyl peptidase
MKPISFQARDGLTVHGYLTTPPGIPAKNLPMVLNVHGGPWWRDSWGYRPDVQWLANRGYAVLQVNFRGSTGYGKKFVNAADREWGGKMHNDLVDGVKWVIKQGIADPKRIAIFGGSYGGYATLVGLTFTPDLFCCGVDIVGPSNLITFMNTIPPYWKTWEATWWARVGHPVKDAEFLKSRSPLFKVDQITKPLLIAQGANDPRVKKTESLQMVESLKKAGKLVKYVEYPDEGHGFARPENRLDFFAKAEKFLADHVGGRYEP